MTTKCALGDLPAGGGKLVIMNHTGLERGEAFAFIGQRLANLNGIFRTAGDLGTTADDLAIAAKYCDYVHIGEQHLSEAVAQGLVHCLKAVRPSLRHVRVAIQGCGAIGAAVASALHREGAQLWVADLNAAAAQRVAQQTGATLVSPSDLLTLEVDVLAPCAKGGVLDEKVAATLNCAVVCGAANNIFTNEKAERAALQRGLTVVPDVLASAGAVICGLSRTLLNNADPTPRIARLGALTSRVLQEAQQSGQPPSAVTHALARTFIETHQH